MATIGDRIRDLRKAKGLTQQELSRILGVSRATLASWETGRRTPDAHTIRSLARTFNTTTDYLLGYSDEPNPSKKTPSRSQPTSVADQEPVFPDRLSAEERELWQQLSLFFRHKKKLTPGQLKAILAILKMDEE